MVAPGPDRLTSMSTRLPRATARCRNPVSPPIIKVESFISPPGDEQRDARGHREARLPDRFQRGPFRGAATEQDLQSALLPVPGQGELPVERPVFMRRTGERLEKKRGPGGIEMMPGKKPLRLIQGTVGQDEFIENFPRAQAALLQQRKIPFRG